MQFDPRRVWFATWLGLIPWPSQARSRPDLRVLPSKEVFNAHTVSKTGKNFFRRNPGKGKVGEMPAIYRPPTQAACFLVSGQRQRKERQRKKQRDVCNSVEVECLEPETMQTLRVLQV